MSEKGGSESDPRTMRVFLAEDDRELRQLIATMLRNDGHFVLEAGDGHALLVDLGHAFWGHDGSPGDSVIISDMRMPERDGLAVLRGIRQESWFSHFILITGFGDPELHAEAVRLGAHAVFDKPFDLELLRDAVRGLAHQHGTPRSQAPVTPASCPEIS